MAGAAQSLISSWCRYRSVDDINPGVHFAS
jgi:hypothetical protein